MEFNGDMEGLWLPKKYFCYMYMYFIYQTFFFIILSANLKVKKIGEKRWKTNQLIYEQSCHKQLTY